MRLGGVGAAAVVMLGGPAVTLAHGLSPAYQSPLPLAVYLAGAAATVALSFVFVLARDMRADPPEPGRVTPVPAIVRHGLRAVGLARLGVDHGPGHRRRLVRRRRGRPVPVGLRLGGRRDPVRASCSRSGSGSTRSPRSTTSARGSCAGSASAAGSPSTLPRSARLWPAVAGFAFFVWLELVAVPGSADADGGPRRLHGPDPRPDGPVRTRPVARRRRDVHRLVPDAQPAARDGRRGRHRTEAPGPDAIDDAFDRPAAVRLRRCSRRPGRRRGSCSSPSPPARSSSTASRRPSPFASVFGAPALLARRRCCCSGSWGSSSRRALVRGARP